MSEGLLLAARVVGVAAGLPLLAWSFGSAVLGRFTRLDREERFAASFGVGLAALAACAFLAFLLHAPQPLFNVAAAVVLLGTAVVCHRTTEKRPPFSRERPASARGTLAAKRFLAAAFALAYLHLVCVQALLPAYRGSYWYYDWWMHYDEARLFLGEGDVGRTWANGYTVASRTPLFNLATAFVMGVAGRDFDTYQLASALPNVCFVLAVFLLLRGLFGRRAAWLALLLAPLNLWMLHNAWFTWPKMLAAYYLVLALHFYLQWVRCRGAGYFFCSWAAALLAYMTHQVALVYILPLLPHAAVLAVRDRAFRPRPRELLACALLALVVAGPWYAWLAGTLGGDKITGSTPVTLGDESARFSPRAVAGWMAFNLAHSVAPHGVWQALRAGWPPDLAELHRGLTQLYFSLLTGAVTISLSAFLLVAAARRLWRLGGRWGERRGLPPPSAPPGQARRLALPATKGERNGPAVWSAVWLFLAGGTLGAAFLHPGKIDWGIAHSAAFPSAVVLVALAWGVLARAGRAGAALVCAGMVLEFVLMFWSHWWLLFHDRELLEPGSGTDPLRPESVRLLNEALGGADVVFLAGAVLVQAALVVLLFAYWRRPAADSSGATT